MPRPPLSRYEVVLTIDVNRRKSDHPAEWDWRTLLDLDGAEGVIVQRVTSSDPCE
jgi:hypothetical protein